MNEGSFSPKTPLQKLIAYFADRHLLSNLMFLVVFLAGLVAWKSLKKEEMPDVSFDFVRISASYPGASAEEVEHFVTKPLEEQVRGMDGVYRITSNSSEGNSSISVELEQSYPDKNQAIMDIRNAVLDARLPDDVRDEPVVRVFKTSKMAIIDICLYDTDRHILDIPSRKRLQRYAHSLENQLLNLPEVNSVNKSGYLKEEIQVMLDPAKLRRYNIPFSTVMQEVRANHVRQPAGSIEAAREPKVTLLSELDSAEKLDGVIVQGGFEGQAVRLREIADIVEGFEKNKAIIKVNGHEAVLLNVVKNSSYGILDAISSVTRKARDFEENLNGSSIRLTLLDDESVDLKNRLNLIFINGGIGFILILIALLAFLNLRSGFWVAMGLPFTFCFTLAGMSFLGYTINNITLAAVILVMGMVVDDAIVVSENITRLGSSGVPAREACITGTGTMFAPIVASIITTCIAFVPLFFFEGRFGQMNKFIPPVIFLMLGASLIESLIILPGHMHLKVPLFGRLLARLQGKRPPKKGHWFDKVEQAYGRLLTPMLGFKWVIFTAFMLLLGFSFFLAKNKMKFVMFPNEETREILITGETDPKSDRYATARLSAGVEEVLKPYIGKEVIGFRTQIARSRRGGAVEENRFRTMVEIVPKEKREKSADTLIGEWQAGAAGISGIRSMKFSKSRWGQSSGSPLEILVQESSDASRDQAARLLTEGMKKDPSLKDVEIEQPLRVPEYKISLNREKIKRLSINPSDVSSTIRAALQGTILYSLTAGDEEIDVRFTTVDSAKDNIEKILDIPIGNRGDYLVPLRDIVSVKPVETPNSVERQAGKRVTKVFADIKPASGITPVEAAERLEAEVFPAIYKKFPTVALSFDGEVRDTRESKGEFLFAIILVIAMIYLILVLFFGSLLKPIFMMITIPFGVVGIILSFWLHGKLLFGFFAAVGALGLAGVVINDSIIMLSRLDEEYDDSKGRSGSAAQIAAVAQTRLRAVVLTTLTTVAGLFPTAYGVAGYDAMLAEMMLALAWGLVFGTLITLVLVPCVYAAAKDIKYIVKEKLSV